MSQSKKHYNHDTRRKFIRLAEGEGKPKRDCVRTNANPSRGGSGGTLRMRPTNAKPRRKEKGVGELPTTTANHNPKQKLGKWRAGKNVLPQVAGAKTATSGIHFCFLVRPSERIQQEHVFLKIKLGDLQGPRLPKLYQGGGPIIIEFHPAHAGKSQLPTLT